MNHNQARHKAREDEKEKITRNDNLGAFTRLGTKERDNTLVSLKFVIEAEQQVIQHACT